MNPVLRIFRKDVRQLWPQILAWVGLAILAAFLDPTYLRRNPTAVEQLAQAALPLACWNLIAAAIHAERLPGDRQYWLTRPISRRALAGAKALLVLAFVNLPVLAIQAGVLATQRIPFWEHWSDLLWRQAFLTAFLILPGAAVAAVTRNLKQVVVAVLLVAVPVFLIELAPFLLRMGPELSLLLIQVWSGDLWIRTVYIALATFAACLAVLGVQYWRRATAIARVLFAAGLAGCVWASSLASPQRAVAFQEALSPNRVTASAFQISPGPGAPVALLRPNGRRGQRVRLEIPTHFETPPPGMEFLSIALEGSLQGVPVEGGDLSGTAAAPVLAVYLTTQAFDRVKTAPADLRGTVDLTLFEPMPKMPAPGTRPVPLPHIGTCASRPDADGRWSILCYSPFPGAALALEYPGGGRHWVVTRRTADVPIPASGSFAPLERFIAPVSFESEDELARMHLVVERPVATIRRSFQFRSLRLPQNPAR